MVYIRPDREGQPDWATSLLVAQVVLDVYTEKRETLPDVAVWDAERKTYVVVTSWTGPTNEAIGSEVPAPTE
jgi:hypothetical protein